MTVTATLLLMRNIFDKFKKIKLFTYVEQILHNLNLNAFYLQIQTTTT